MVIEEGHAVGAVSARDLKQPNERLAPVDSMAFDLTLVDVYLAPEPGP